MKTMTVCFSWLLVGLAIFAAQDNPATARENRRNTKRPCCPPACAAIRPATHSPATVVPAPPISVEDAELRAMQEERRDALKKRAEILMNYQHHGISVPSLVVQAQIELLEAELPLAKSHAERIILYEKSLAARTEIEKLTQEMRELGVGNPEDHLRAKADRIKAEIDLYNARKMK